MTSSPARFAVICKCLSLPNQTMKAAAKQRRDSSALPAGEGDAVKGDSAPSVRCGLLILARQGRLRRSLGALATTPEGSDALTKKGLKLDLVGQGIMNLHWYEEMP